MQRYPSPKLAAEIHQCYLKIALKIKQKLKKYEKLFHSENGRKYRRILKVSASVATFKFSIRNANNLNYSEKIDQFFTLFST